MLRRALLFCFLACLASVAWGQDFGLDLGCCSDPLTQSATVDVNNGGVHDYYNSTLDPITELEFAINVGAGRAATSAALTTLLSGYKCIAFEFFGTCDKSYDNGSGTLFLDFGGVNLENLDGDEGFGNTDPETRASEGDSFVGPEGLPTLESMACLLTPNQDPCKDRGHFVISFNTFLSGDQFNGATCTSNEIEGCANQPLSGGTWNSDAAASIVEINGKPVPEPSSMVFFATGVLLIGLRVRHTARRRA